MPGINDCSQSILDHEFCIVGLSAGEYGVHLHPTWLSSLESTRIVEQPIFASDESTQLELVCYADTQPSCGAIGATHER
ncbi:hypothetical protein B0H34DRAFT_709281 [Crassisporium funariophilum]|nr:hypothetical protein B0H34DRAFT_709281 [Crassisporium funariophilum]